MPNICFLCASDEGIFLDISEDTRFFLKIETCLSLKASKNDALSTKLCHKCAYELDKCNDFVHKYKDRKLEKNTKQKKNCFFCQEPGKKGYFFNLKKTNKRNDAFKKIYYLFDELSNETDFFICLSCRYSIDLLFDLKSLSEEVSEKLHRIIDEGIDVDLLAKTRTTIVRRKTTRIKNPRIGLQTPSDTESDSSTMARGTGKMSGKKANKKTNNRFCDECQSETEKGVDMFRIHRTGRTVCKNCWITMDPEKNAGKNKRKRIEKDPDTKSCKVFLQDVVRSASTKDPKPYKVDKGEDGRLVFTITDDSSGNESRSSTKTKAQLKQLPELKQSTRRTSKKTFKNTETVEISDESFSETDIRQKTRGKNVKNVKVEKPKPVGKEKTLKEEKPKYEKPTRTQNKAAKVDEAEKSTPASRKRANGNQNLNSEVSQAKKTRSSSIESIASSESVSRVKKSVRQTRNRGDSESTVKSEDSSQLEDSPKRRVRGRSDSAVSVSSTPSSKKGIRGKKASISSKESTPVSEFKSPPSVSKPAVAKRGKGKPIKSQDDDRTSFACAVCNADFSNKKEYTLHQEQHLKDFEIKLQRVPVEEKPEETERLNIIQEEAEQEEMNTEKSKEIEERLKDSKKPEDSFDEEQSDNIALELHDETEESVENAENKKDVIPEKKTESVQEGETPVVLEDKTESVLEDKVELAQENKADSLKDKTESAQEEPILKENSPNSKQGTEEKSSHSQDEENLEDLLQNEDLQVIDEVAESVSSAADPEEETGKEVPEEKDESVDEESQENFSIAYTASSQASVTNISALNSQVLEETEKCDQVIGNVEKEDLEKSFEKEDILEKEETSIEEKKEFDDSEQKVSSLHSTPTKDKIERDDDTEESQTQVEVPESELEPIQDIPETSQVLQETEDLSEINPTVPETEDNLEQESLPQEIEDVVQNGLELVENQKQLEKEIIDEIENSKVESESEIKAQNTVSEVLQEVFNLATSKTNQKEETEKMTVSFSSQENLEEISNDALNGGDMPSLETDESEVSNL